MLKKESFIFIIITVVIIIGLSLYFIFFYNYTDSIDDSEWTQPEVELPDYSFGTLYNTNNIIELDELFLNSIFVKQVEINHLLYLYGYSNDGSKLAYIGYDEKSIGYKINIYDILDMEDVFSIFIPKNDLMFESDEFIMGKNILESIYKIDSPTNKLTWYNDIEYNIKGKKWYFDTEFDDNKSYLKVSDTNNNYWSILMGKNYDKPTYIEIFTFKNNPEIISFIFYYSKHSNMISECKIYTMDLAKLNNNNSNEGKNVEADNWLYGDFTFVYNQWNTRFQKGFFAISINDDINKNEGTYKKVDQWVYIDSSGLMQWHGSYDGIFNRKGESLFQLQQGVYYRINLIEEKSSLESTYFVFDIYDYISDTLIKTIEFGWGKDQNSIYPLQIDEGNI